MQLCLANMPLGMKETRNEDVIYLYGLLGSQTISFSVPCFLFSQWASVRKKQEPLVVQTRLRVSLHAPACSNTTALDQGSMLDAWARPFPPTCALGSLLFPMADNTSISWTGPSISWTGQLSVEDTETETLETTCKWGRQGCLSLAQSLGQHGCMAERHAQQPWSQWGVLVTEAAVVSVAARETKKPQKCLKPCFWSAVKYLTIKPYKNVNNGDATYLYNTSGK